MIRGGPAALLMLLALTSCRSYDYYSRISEPDGMVPGDQFARYGREQAQAVAIARGFAGGEADSAVVFARKMPDVTNVVADPQSYRLTVDFRSGWRLGVVPLDDGKAPAETPGLPAAGGR